MLDDLQRIPGLLPEGELVGALTWLAVGDSGQAFYVWTREFPLTVVCIPVSDVARPKLISSLIREDVLEFLRRRKFVLQFEEVQS